MFFDSHLHLQNKEFELDRQNIIDTLSQRDIDMCVCVGYDLESSRQALELATANQNIYAAVGVHPSDSNIYNKYIQKELYKMGEHKKVVAIGEIGLDYHYEHTDKQKQKLVFARQIGLANILKKPYIIHMRDAFEDFEIGFSSVPPKYGAVIHCYTGDALRAIKYVAQGYHISFSGIITYKNAQYVREAVDVVPLERLLIETDLPYLAPTPYRGKVNYPEYISYVAQEIAIIKNKSVAEIAAITKSNAKKLFGIV